MARANRKLPRVPPSQKGKGSLHGTPESDTISYLRYSLADICVDGEWDLVSLHRFMNRVVFMSGMQVAYVVCRKPRRRPVKILMRSVRDPLCVRYFDDQVRELFRGWRAGEAGDLAFEDHAVRLLHSPYSLVLFERKLPSNSPPLIKPNPQYRPLHSTEALVKLFRSVFKPFDVILQNVGIETHVNRILQSAWGPSVKIVHAPNDHPGTVPGRQNITRRIVHNNLQEVTKIIARCYERAWQSPLLTPNAELPANILFFAKIFDRIRTDTENYDDLPRHEAYFFNTHVILPPLQRQHIQMRFSVLANGRRGHWPAYPSPRHDEWFWSTLQTKNGPETLIETILAPTGPDVRLFVDSALSAGVVQVDPEPFQLGQIGWLHSYPKDRDRLLFEHRRLCVLHYLFLAMAPKSAKRPSLLTLPMRVGGATWIAAVTVRESNNKQVVGEEWFQRSYLLYHSILRPIERRIRRWSREGYIQHAALAVKNFLSFFRYDEFQLKADFDDIDLLDTNNGDEVEAAMRQLNFDLRDLCRVFPYERIVVHRRWAPNRVPLEVKLMGLFMSIEPNDFFDRVRLARGRYLNVQEVAREVGDIIRAYAALELYRISNPKLRPLKKE